MGDDSQPALCTGDKSSHGPEVKYQAKKALWLEKRQQQESRKEKGTGQVEKFKILEKIEPFHIKWSWEQKGDTWSYLLLAFPHACRRDGRVVLKWVKWMISSVKVKAVDTVNVLSGGDERQAGQAKAGGAQGEWIPLHVIEKVPCQEAAHLLHTICISEEIKGEVFRKFSHSQ